MLSQKFFNWTEAPKKVNNCCLKVRKGEKKEKGEKKITKK